MILGQMPEAEYRARPTLSKSDLIYLAESPLHFQQRKSLFKETDDMRLGTLIHTALLEPKRLAESYLVEPEEIEYWSPKAKKSFVQPINRRSDYCRDALEAWRMLQDPSRMLVKPEMVEKLTQVMNACSHPERHDSQVFRDFLNLEGEVEVAAEMEIGGVLVKGRADKLITHPFLGRTVVEVKTCQDSSPSGFSRQIYNLNYDIGISLYLKLFEAENYVFAVVQTKDPFPLSLYRASDAMIARAHKRTLELLKLYRECMTTNTWPAYTKDVEWLEYPAWVGALDSEDSEL